MAEPIAWASEEEWALSVEMPNKKQDVSYIGISDRTTIFFSVSMSHIFHEINLSKKSSVADLDFQFNWVSCFYGVIFYCICLYVFLSLAAPALTLQTLIPAAITFSWPWIPTSRGCWEELKKKCVDRVLQAPKNYKIK